MIENSLVYSKELKIVDVKDHSEREKNVKEKDHRFVSKITKVFVATTGRDLRENITKNEVVTAF